MLLVVQAEEEEGKPGGADTWPSTCILNVSLFLCFNYIVGF